jgi:hypothetical protein
LELFCHLLGIFVIFFVSRIRHQGPQGSKAGLLLLDDTAEWLGRFKPKILGEEGAALAAESGTKTLADILAAANGKNEDAKKKHNRDGDGDSDCKGTAWVDGVGEGREDEDNLSAYYRFSEGDDEDRSWTTDGVKDLTKYRNVLTVVGSNVAQLEPTTTSVDEGEEGKVALLHDVLCTESCDRDRVAGLLIEAPRGSSVDVGVLQTPDHAERQRCTVEFWFYCPPSHLFEDELILARRGSIREGQDSKNSVRAAGRDGMIWELVLLQSGKLEFRSGDGAVLKTGASGKTSGGPNHEENQMEDSSDSEDEGGNEQGVVSFQREGGSGGWNHVCLILTSKGHATFGACHVRILLKGAEVASSVLSVIPGGCTPSAVEDVMAKTALLFGLGATAGFRLTELRIWACERQEDDIKAMMYEYLSAAEQKKKFKIRIRGKNDGMKPIDSQLKPKSIALALPKKTAVLLPERRSRVASIDTGSKTTTTLAVRGAEVQPSAAASFDVFFQSNTEAKDSQSEQPDFFNNSDFASSKPWGLGGGISKSESMDFENYEGTPSFDPNNDPWGKSSAVPFTAAFGPIEEIKIDDDPGSSQQGLPGKAASNEQLPSARTNKGQTAAAAVSIADRAPKSQTGGTSREDEKSTDPFGVGGTFAPVISSSPTVAKGATSGTLAASSNARALDDDASNSDSVQSLYFSEQALLSQQVRKSVAAAILRGPPAARHFGGNRGGIYSRSRT